MNRKLSMRWGLAGAAALATVAGMGGCELIVDFDRSKIPVGDASEDTTVSETDDASEAATPGDAAGDGSVGTSTDAAVDAPPMVDAGGDVVTTGTAETGTPDTGSSDATTDTGSADAPIDVVTTAEAGPDAAPEAGPEDAGSD